MENANNIRKYRNVSVVTVLLSGIHVREQNSRRRRATPAIDDVQLPTSDVKLGAAKRRRGKITSDGFC